MSRALQIERKIFERSQTTTNNYSDEGHLPAGTQVVAEVKRDVMGCLYLASYARYELLVATSCLIAPEEGDRIRATVDQKKLYVTDILVRKHAKPLQIFCRDQELQIQAKSMSLHADENFSLNAESISLQARLSRWVSQRMNQITRHWFTQADDIYREVKYSEEVKAKNIRHNAGESLTLKGNLTSVIGTSVVKVDGSQIHMG